MDRESGVLRQALTFMTDGARRDVEQMLVHNLRTPLTGLLATLEMLGDGDFGALGASQQSAVEAMRSQGAELLALVDELLDVWRMEAPEMRVRAARVNVPALLHVVGAEWTPRFRGRLTMAIADGCPDGLGDPEILRRVAGNLLRNVEVHAGPEAPVRLSAGSDGVVLFLDIEDDGPGVPEAVADRVFEKFVRGDSVSGAARGTGLGLAYCRAAMEAQGGRITLQRRPGQGGGAHFRLELPVAPAPAGVAEQGR